MQLLLFMLSVVLIILSIPYIRCLIKRIVMVFRLTSVCKKHGHTLHPAHPLWMFGNRYGSACDFHIETEDRIYAVKLFEVPYKSSTLVFDEGGMYFSRYNLRLTSPIGATASLAIPGRKRYFRDYSFRNGVRDEWMAKTPQSILLLNPTCFEIHLRQNGGHECPIFVGESVYDFKVESLSHLLSKLQTAG